MEHKTFPCVIIKADEEQGIVDTIFAVMGNIDEGDDVIHNGAFTKTFMEQGRKIRVLDQHRTDSTEAVIGKPVELREIGIDELPASLRAEYPEATGGAHAKVQMLMDTRLGKEVFIRLRDKAIDEWSFGYDALDVDYETVKVNGEDRTIRNLRTLKLYEISPVIWGMNPATTTTGAKSKEEKPYDIFESDGEYCVYKIDEDGNQTGDSLGCHPTREEAEEQLQAILISEAEDEQGKDKGATGKAGLPLAPREREWDASAAEGRVRSRAGGEDNMDWAKYRQGFFWYDSDNANEFGSYKLPFADVIGGELQAVPRGLFAVAGVLQGARGGTNIPSDDIDPIKSKVNSYYASMRREFDDDSIIPPWDKAITWETIDSLMREYYSKNNITEPTDEAVKAAMLYAFKEYTPQGPIQRLGDVLQGNIHKVFSQIADTLYIKGMLITEERIALSNAIGDALEVFVVNMPLSVAEREVYYYDDYYCGYGYMSNDTETEEKIGRVLSSRNAGRIVNALTVLIEVLEAAGIDIPGFGEQEEEEELNDELAEKLGAGPVFPPTLLMEIERELLEIAMEE